MHDIPVQKSSTINDQRVGCDSQKTVPHFSNSRICPFYFSNYLNEFGAVYHYKEHPEIINKTQNFPFQFICCNNVKVNVCNILSSLHTNTRVKIYQSQACQFS